MPKPELYVIYTGDQGSHPDVLSMKDEFFPHADCCIEAKVKIIYLHRRKTPSFSYGDIRRVSFAGSMPVKDTIQRR